MPPHPHPPACTELSHLGTRWPRLGLHRYRLWKGRECAARNTRKIVFFFVGMGIELNILDVLKKNYVIGYTTSVKKKKRVRARANVSLFDVYFGYILKQKEMCSAGIEVT